MNSSFIIRRIRKCGSSAAIVLTLAVASSVQAADLKLHNSITDMMVLQRGKPITVKGTAPSGKEVTVSFAGQETSAVADKAGNWGVKLDAMNAQARGGALVASSGGKTVSLKDVVVGDVWFFGRQTYVDISLGRNAEGEAAARVKPSGDLRVMMVKSVPNKNPQDELGRDRSFGWLKVDSKTALKMSAAAFYFGKDLVKEVGVPVGIIDVNMSHHFSIGWLSAKAIADAPVIYPHKNDIAWLPAWMQKRAEERDSGKAQKDLDEYYQTLMKGKGEKPYLGLHPLSDPMYPSAGYNAVINLLKHLAMKGILLQLGNDYPFIAYRELEKKGMLTKKSGYDSGWQDNYMILK